MTIEKKQGLFGLGERLVPGKQIDMQDGFDRTVIHTFGEDGVVTIGLKGLNPTSARLQIFHGSEINKAHIKIPGGKHLKYTKT